MTKRTIGKHKADISTKNFYRYYVKNTPKNSIYNLTPRQYGNILKDINIEIMKLIITTNFELQITPRLGTLSIKKFKTKLVLDKNGDLIKTRLSIDFGKTNALWKVDPEAKKNKKVVYHINRHTDGYRYKFYWNKKYCAVKHKSFYTFKAARDNNRMIASAINTIPNLDYFEF